MSRSVQLSYPQESAAGIFNWIICSQITITSNNQLKEISFHNTLGQAVLRQSCNSNRVSVDVVGLPVGVYFIRVVDVNGRKRTEKGGEAVSKKLLPCFCMEHEIPTAV